MSHTRKTHKRKSVYEKSVAKTLALRPEIKAEFLPLFDHCVSLAASAHAHGSPKRAGLDLLHARRLTRFK